MFIADVLGPYDVYKGPANVDPALPSGAQFPVNDPLYVVPAMAAVTKNLTFGVTASTTYETPYALARRFSTVDHLSEGRVSKLLMGKKLPLSKTFANPCTPLFAGWNIVTSYLDSAARNFGLDTQVEHDERYRIAEEYMEVVYKASSPANLTTVLLLIILLSCGRAAGKTTLLCGMWRKANSPYLVESGRSITKASISTFLVRTFASLLLNGHLYCSRRVLRKPGPILAQSMVKPSFLEAKHLKR